MVDVSNKHKSITVAVSSKNGNTVVAASSDTAQYWANQSHTFANQAKESVQEAKEYAELANSYIEGFEDVVSKNTDSIISTGNDYINQITGAADAGIADINSTKTTILNDIEFVADGEKKEIQGLVDDEKEEIKDLANLIKENAQDIASRTSFAMFDTVLKDHILTYEESKGLALQGTYVYKEAVAGSRYGYADFYNKCLQEFENSEYEKIKFEQPVLSANGTLGGDSFAVSASLEQNSGSNIYYAYRCFASDANTSETTSWQALATTASYTIYNPKALNITNIQITNRSSHPRAIASGMVLGSNDNDTWEEITSFTNTNNNTSFVWNIDLSNNKKSYKYYKLDNLKGLDGEWIGIGKINITATYNSVFKANANGHIFYDIADKNQIDELFNQTGMAWFYGIDQENERIFLPRNKYVAIKGSADSVTVDVFGTGKTLGLTNGEQNIGLITYSAGVIGGMTGCYNKNYGTGTGGDWNRNQKAFGVVKDATKSGLTGKADTSQVVQIDDSKYLYICVGNTEATSTVTDVVEVTTTENDTIPLGYSVYQANGQPSVSWLKSQGQWNDGNVYVTFYNEFVNKLGQDFASGKVVEVTDEYTVYDLVINQDDMTFRLPLLDGSEDLPSEKYVDLTLNATGSTYTAPANGWVNITYKGQSSDTYVELSCDKIESSGYENTTNFGAQTVYAKRGDIFRLIYRNLGLREFRFIYAQGNGSLYFKVANAVQNLELLDAGEVLEAVNDINAKVDTTPHIIETYVNGTSWYRVYSDGWCEQGGRGALNEVATTTITLLKPYKDTNYSVSAVSITASTAGDTEAGLQCTPKSTTQITLTAHYLNPNNQTACWEAKGYIA